MLPKLFRIDCADQPEQVKVTIKEALSDWFDPREFPRGWIAGPVMCLWRTAMTNDNIVYAIILRDGWRTRIIGFTLSQFARSFFIFALLGAIVWLIASTVQGDLFHIGTLPLAIFCGAALAVLIFWPESSQEDRTVTFLREAVEGQTGKPRLQPAFTKARNLWRGSRTRAGCFGPIGRLPCDGRSGYCRISCDGRRRGGIPHPGSGGERVLSISSRSRRILRRVARRLP